MLSLHDLVRFEQVASGGGGGRLQAALAAGTTQPGAAGRLASAATPMVRDPKVRALVWHGEAANTVIGHSVTWVGVELDEDAPLWVFGFHVPSPEYMAVVLDLVVSEPFAPFRRSLLMSLDQVRAGVLGAWVARQQRCQVMRDEIAPLNPVIGVLEVYEVHPALFRAVWDKAASRALGESADRIAEVKREVASLNARIETEAERRDNAVRLASDTTAAARRVLVDARDALVRPGRSPRERLADLAQVFLDLEDRAARDIGLELLDVERAL